MIGDMQLGPLDVALMLIVGVTSWTDLRTQRIRNVHTFPTMLLGLILQTMGAGTAGLWMALLGIGAGFLGMSPLYAMGIMKAGDVKLAMALGALMGGWEILRAVVLSFVLYLPVGLVVLLLSGRLRQSWVAFKRLAFFLYARFHPALTPEPLNMEGMTLAPFGMVLGVAALLVHFGDWLSSRGFIPGLF